LLVGTDRLALVTTRLAERYAGWLPLKLVPFPVKIPPLIELLQWHKAHSQNAAHLWFRTQIKEAAARMELAGAVENKRECQQLQRRRIRIQPRDHLSRDR
jgi:hypothetical protein